MNPDLTKEQIQGILADPRFEDRLLSIYGDVYTENEWQAEVKKSDARFKVIAAGRRSGKTYYASLNPVDGLIRDFLTPDSYTWIVAPSYDLTQRVWRLFLRVVMTRFGPLVKSLENSSGRYKIETIFDSVIEAKSADDPKRLVGVGLTHLVMDECGEIPGEAWTQLRPSLMDRKGRALLIGRPQGKNWFYTEWLRGKRDSGSKDPEYQSWHFTSFDNNLLSKDEIQKTAVSLSARSYREEILSEFVEGEGSIFRDIRGRISGTLLPYNPAHSYVMGCDLGRKFSDTVIVVINEQTRHIDYFEEIEDTDWNVQINRIKAVYADYRSPTFWCDASGNADKIIEDLEMAGVAVEPYIFTTSSKPPLIENLVLFMERKWITYPRIERLLTEMERFSFKKRAGGRYIYRSPIQTDAVMATALACWGLEKPYDEDRVCAECGNEEYTSKTHCAECGSAFEVLRGTRTVVMPRTSYA